MKDGSKTINETQPIVSVIITTKNEEKNIRICLESIKLQTWSAVEIIVVDNNSSDDTKAIARNYTEKIYNKGPERSAQRNYGMIEKAVGQYAIYVDADMILSPILIEACVNYIRRTDAVALHVSEAVLGTSYFSRVRRFERSFYDGTAIDGARFFCREIFVQAGGFDEITFNKGSGEDWDIDKLVKQRGSIKLLPRFIETEFDFTWPLQDFIEKNGVLHNKNYAGIYHNEVEFNLINYLKKKLYYSAGFDGYINKWGRNDPDIKRQFGFTYRLWTVFTENHKWERLVRRLDLAAGMYFLRIGVGLVFLLAKLSLVSRRLKITRNLKK